MGMPVFDLWGPIQWGFDKAAAVAKFFIYKGLALGLIVTLVPVTIFYGWSYISKFILEAVNSIVGGSDLWNGTLVQFTGLAAWIGDKLRFTECMSAVMSGYAVRFALGLFRM